MSLGLVLQYVNWVVKRGGSQMSTSGTFPTAFQLLCIAKLCPITTLYLKTLYYQI